jgi:hypothetical protein
VSLHRDIIIEKEAYESEEWGEENLLNYLKQDNPWDPYWDQYGIDEAQWSAKPDTWYIAFSIAKNANDEWGPLAGVEFKTPGNSTGVNELASGKAQIIIGANAITATGNKADSEVKVYDMNGRMVASACADANGNAIISTSGLNHGVYVVVNGKSAQKFMK